MKSSCHNWRIVPGGPGSPMAASTRRSPRVVRRYRGIAASVEDSVGRLLRSVPDQDLVGLEAIFLLDEVSDRISRRKGIRGLYWPKSHDRSASIELAVTRILGNLPRSLLAIRLVQRILLAEVLFHEIAHHVQIMHRHGIAKTDQEKWAERYVASMTRQAFPIIRAILWPLTKLRSCHVLRAAGKGASAGGRVSS